MSILYITHDLSSARTFADRIAVLYAGRLIELGEAREVYARPLHPYTKALIEAVPSPDPANRERLRPVVAGEPPSPMALPSGCAFHPRCPVAIEGVCATVQPPLITLGDGRQVACHLVTGDAP